MNIKKENLFSDLAWVTALRTYSRRKPDGTRESWEEIVDRVIEGNGRRIKIDEQERKTLRRFMLARKALAAGRGLWYSGSESHGKLGGTALNSCWFRAIDHWRNYVVSADLLMLGGGVGASVEKEYVSQLPKVKTGVKIEHKATNDADFIVPDSREGWLKLLERTLEAYFDTGKSFTFSTVCIRPRGTPIKGFGGTASGPDPLVTCIENIVKILSVREGKRIDSVDAADILCAIGEMVVSGNVRRSALIIIGDCWDKRFLSCKRFSTGFPPYRGMANWSVVCDDVADLHPAYWDTYRDGEAFGIVNRKNIQQFARIGHKKKDVAIGVNPCQPAWATVLTPDGIRQMSDIDVGSRIWGGTDWVTVTRKVATGTKDVYRFVTRAGVFVGTKDHRVVSGGEKIQAGRADAIDSSVGPAPDVFDGEAYREASSLTIGNNTTSIPDHYRFGGPTHQIGFLRAAYDQLGEIVDDEIILRTRHLSLVEQTRELLSAVGIRSHYRFASPIARGADGVAIPIASSDPDYVLVIDGVVDIARFMERVGFRTHNENRDRLLELVALGAGTNKIRFEVVGREFVGSEEVFDITVDHEAHTYWTGGLLVSNCGEATLSDDPCSLFDIFLPNLSGEAEFEQAARLAVRYLKRVTCEDYHYPEINEAVHKYRRIGIGISGCLQSPLFTPEILDRVYEAIQDEDRKYSKEIGVPESIRLTLIKPSGTLSLIAATPDHPVFPGIHPLLSQYLIRRITFSNNHPMIPVLRDAGYHIEPRINMDGSIDPYSLIVEFYVAGPDDGKYSDRGYDTWKQLDDVLMAMRYWADQSVSVTVYYDRDNDIPLIKKWLTDHLDEIKTISFLPRFDSGFKQMPMEPITKEQYLELTSRLKPIDYGRITIPDGDIVLDAECANGACPIK